MLIKALAPGFYSRQDTKTPVRIAVIAMVSNMVLNIILVFPLQHAGLALATSISAGINAFLLFRGLRKESVYMPDAGWVWLIARVLLACILMIGIILYFNPGMEFWLSAARIDKVLWLTGLILAGVIVYFIVLFIVGVRRQHFRHRPT